MSCAFARGFLALGALVGEVRRLGGMLLALRFDATRGTLDSRRRLRTAAMRRVSRCSALTGFVRGLMRGCVSLSFQLLITAVRDV